MNRLAGYGKVINFNTSPVINTYVYDRDGYWNCNDWMVWHQKLVEAFKLGKFASKIKYSPADALKKSNEVFMIWWGKQSWYNYAEDQCVLLNQTFRKYFKDVAKLNLDAAYTAAAAPFDAVTRIIEGAGNSVENIVALAENATAAAANTGKTLKWVLPALLVVGGVGLSVFAYYKFIKPVRQPGLGRIKRKTSRKSKRR